jgi:hypothetical protein
MSFDKIDQPKDTLEPKALGEDLLSDEIEKIKETTPEREWKIKRLQETAGLSREMAERMVDESFGTN